MLFSGLRTKEVIELKLSDVNLNERSIRFMGKGRKERVVPLSNVLIVYIKKYLKFERPKDSASTNLFVILQGQGRGCTMTTSGIRSLFRYRKERFNLSKSNAHRLRHTFGSNMAKQGVRLPTLQKMMGHSSPEITLKYIELSGKDLVDEFDRVMKNIKEPKE